jgi:hypothetical protein
VLPADKVSRDTAELTESAQGSAVVHLRKAPSRTGFTTHHATRNGTAGSKVVDDAPQSGFGVARYAELPGYDVPRSHAQSSYENSIAPWQTSLLTALAKTFDHRAQRSTAASHEYQARNVRSIQELFRARSGCRVTRHNLNLQRRLLTQQLDEHRPESAYDRVTVAQPGTTVDDQQDSFSYWQRMPSRFTNTMPFPARCLHPFSKSNSKASLIQAFGSREKNKLKC